MNLSTLVVVVSMAVVLGVSAEDTWRTFTSADGEKSFVGSLVAYAEATEKVKMKLKNGKQAELPLDSLSRNDVKWIKETGVWQLRVAKLEVKLQHDRVSEEVIADEKTGALLFLEREEEAKRRKAGEDPVGDGEAGQPKERTIRISKEGFKILISNPGKEDIEGLACDYVFYALRKVADEKEVTDYKGSFPATPIKAGEPFHATTRHINLDRSEKILGMALYIKHGGEIIRTVKTSPDVDMLQDDVEKRDE